MEAWQKVWRIGLEPQLSDLALGALLTALEEDDGRLLQGATTSPPPLPCVQDWPVEACCGISWCGWQGEGLQLVGQVEEYFARTCFKADEILDEPAACRHCLKWFDDTPRAEMRHLLAAEVKSSIIRRAKHGAAQA